MKSNVLMNYRTVPTPSLLERWVSRLSAFVALLCGLGTATPALAQTGTSHAGGRSDSLASITTDTGALAPGRREFSRYLTPEQCLIAATGVYQEARLSFQLRHAIDSSDGAIIATRVTGVARACLAAHHFKVQEALPYQLVPLFELAVYAHDDSLAQAVVARKLRTAATPEDTARVYVHAIDQSAEIHPLPLSLAHLLLNRLDSLGRPALVHRIVARGELMSELRFRGSDTAMQRALASQVITLGSQATPAEVQINSPAGRQEPGAAYALVNAFNVLVYQLYRGSGPPDSLVALAHLAKRELSYCKNLINMEACHVNPDASDREVLWHFVFEENLNQPEPAPMVVGTDTAAFTTGALRTMLQHPLHSDFFFPATAHDTVRPVPGQVNLYWVVRGYNLQNGDMGSDGGTFSTGLRRAIARHLVAVTILVSTRGWQWRRTSNGDWDEVLVFDTARQEAEYLRWYFQEFLQLPVAVAVQVDTPLLRPAPDGRRMPEPWQPSNGLTWRLVTQIPGNPEKKRVAWLIGPTGTLLSEFPPELAHVVRAGIKNGVYESPFYDMEARTAADQSQWLAFVQTLAHVPGLVRGTTPSPDAASAASPPAGPHLP